MRILIQLDITKLPQQYRMILLAFIKQMLRNGDPELYSNLYNNDERKPKKLTYSLYMRDFKFEEAFYVMNGATLIFSTSDPRIGVACMNGLMTTKTFKYSDDIIFNIQSINLENEVTIQHTVGDFKILNGLLVENAQKKPLLVTDPNFEKELNYIMNRKFEALYGRKLKSSLEIIGHRLKKIVVQETNRHANGVKLYYTGQKGTITLKGHHEDLTLILRDGLGLRTSSGWGTLSYIQGRRGSFD